MSGGEERVVAQPIHSVADKANKRELWAMICYYYPQYTLKEASQLPVRDIKLLLRVADKLEARKKYDLTQIVAAPHTKKGSGVKKLTEHFRKQME